FLPRALKVGRDLHAPAGLAQQRRLDEIVAQDRAAERRAAGHRRQSRGLCKGAYADDRVMAPEIAFVLAPPADAGAEKRSVGGGGELLPAREQRLAADKAWDGLNEPRLRRLLHAPDKLDHCRRV